MIDTQCDSGTAPPIEVDARGVKCPLPVLMARRALRRAPPGQTVRVLADDPMSSIDIPHMCRTDGYHLRKTEKMATWTAFTIGC